MSGCSKPLKGPGRSALYKCDQQRPGSGRWCPASFPRCESGGAAANPHGALLTPPRFPGCLQATSVLANIVWVYGPTNACFDPALPNCTMPDNVETISGMFPVNISAEVPSFSAASTTGEM